MVKVLVNGAKGRMGSAVMAAVGQAEGLTLVGGIDRGDDLATSIQTLKPDVVVDFTVASSGFDNACTILSQGARPVMGTSGFQKDQVEVLSALAQVHGLSGLIAPNFSLGAVLMMKFAAEAARYLPDVEVVEIHSPQKEESPSGTAIRTAELIDAARQEVSTVPAGKELLAGARGATLHNVRLHALRLPGVVAQQTVLFGGNSETLKIEHQSLDRACFMPGVILACRKIGDHKTFLFGLEHLLD